MLPDKQIPTCRKNASPSSQTFKVHHITILKNRITELVSYRSEPNSCCYLCYTKKNINSFRFYVCFVTVNDGTISQNFLVSIKNPQEHLLEHLPVQGHSQT